MRDNLYSRHAFATHSRRIFAIHGWRVFAVVVATVLVPLHGTSRIALAGEATFIERSTDAGLHFTAHGVRSIPGLLGGMQTVMGFSAGVTDYDRDGLLDVFFVDHLEFPNSMFRNTGNGLFTDTTESCGVGLVPGFSQMALFVDLDNDGFQDLIVANDSIGTREYPGTQVYRNSGQDQFINLTSTANLPDHTIIVGGMAASDYDKDGDVDILIVCWALEWVPAKELFYLMRNEGDFRFSDVTESAGLRIAATDVPNWTPVFADFDNDGWQDIFTAVDFTANGLFHNNGDGTFTDISASANIQHIGPDLGGNDMGVAVADFDDDGDLDIYTTNVTNPDNLVEPVYNPLYLNDGGARFTDVALERGVENTYWGWGTAFLDVDNDGDLDLAAVNGWFHTPFNTYPENLFLNDGDGFFIDDSDALGPYAEDSRALVPFDADNDGDLDLVIVNPGQEAGYLQNQLHTDDSPIIDTHYIEIDLVGTISNRDAIGARIYLNAGRVNRMHEIIAGASFRASPPLRVHVGLGTATLIESLDITWPTGVNQSYRDIPADRIITIAEGGDVDFDGDIDLTDFTAFAGCSQGAAVPVAPSCLLFDTDGDADVDFSDFQTFQRAFTGTR